MMEGGSTRSAVGKIVAVIEALARARKAPTVTELGAALGLSRAQAYRIAAALQEEGVLTRHPRSGRLMFGPRLGAAALRIAGGSPINPLWHKLLQDLREAVGETCNLVVFPDATPTYFDRVEAGWPLTLHFGIGTRVPLHCTSAGKLYLTRLPATERTLLLERMDLHSCTPRTFTDRAALAAHLNELAVEGIGIDLEEFVVGMVAIAVPVLTSDDRLLAALSVHAPTARLPPSGLRGLLPQLRRTAADLGAVFDAVG
ncbi:IclR family transcriptional regulator [Azospirillum sp. RWY-5-1]|uniref:IclR family transcriptional regulator n=1 Tax=Azospirillum oleiclasticum TaxID=2735135 RepID=A0ABX2TBY1_9PROT|nr:IclR family transcriptional regulator [Azospirillum oleiclasticum]NYZ14200.1 IclR family transcriptional regulator [Azospirillum oleiclasticum]NYZ21684.1 IclR family transcriptional regulator [Azospirillum oleiclasticum]